MTRKSQCQLILTMYFGSQNLSVKDGKILLSGEAEKFVSGWFGDIAYKRNYIGADSDKKASKKP